MDLAEQEARDVEQVDAEVEDQEALLAREIGLVRVDVVARAPRDPGEERPADGTPLERLADRADRGLEAKVLMHHQRHAGVRAGLNHRPAVVDRGRERLLHDHRHAVRGGELDQLAVARHRGDHVDEVRPLGREHRLRVAIASRHGERGGRLCRPNLVEVAHRSQLDRAFRRKILPGVQMVAGKEAAADHGTPEPGHAPLPAARPPAASPRLAAPPRHASAQVRQSWRDGASGPITAASQKCDGRTEKVHEARRSYRPIYDDWSSNCRRVRGNPLAGFAAKAVKSLPSIRDGLRRPSAAYT